ncbi:serine hydrolase domain-containing protein [Cytophagaceae bacterium YF14B1]|uniref:Serine hydrolase domain-containing protein n=1 Tax=Xanthocytophaga flava TaxID=3048013 RepID=A0AAE3U6M3_9BACT|nr:serine hydrolase domain-containing protein [Xanthocytophaga flavus]MDJ1482009.1 serine hydrolase domain-containing protein [Xanthocytophaga flavus]
MKKALLFLLLFLAASCPCISQNTFSFTFQTTEHRVDSIFSDWNKSDCPGGSVAVVLEGKVLLLKGYGMANIQRHLPNTPQTTFNVASVAKQFTAMCIALLEEEGKLSFDDDIRKFFPEFKLKEKVTVRHLLTHTSGLREAYVLAVLSGKINLKGNIRKKYNTTANMLSLMSNQQDLNFKPGDEHAYTNINYVLLGEIVHRISGMSLRLFADQYIFKPLQMNHTFFNDVVSGEPSTRAVPYQPRRKHPTKFKRKSPIDGGIVGDHNLITTVDDLILWNENFWHNQLGQKDPTLISTMQTPYILNNGDTIHYAFGLNIHSYHNNTAIGHGGDDYRYTSSLVRFPDKHLSIICLANSSRYDDTERKAFALADLMLNIQSQPTDTVRKPYQFLSIDKNFFKDKLSNYEGISKKNRYRFRQILIKDEKVYLAFRPNKSLHELMAIGNNHFVAKVGDPDLYLQIWFSHLENGEVLLHQKFKNDTTHFRMNPSPILQTAELRKYTGSYTNKETHSRMKVKVKKQNLIVTFKGIIHIKTIPIGTHTFYAPDNQAIFQFGGKEKDRIDHFVIGADDFRNVRFEK